MLSLRENFRWKIFLSLAVFPANEFCPKRDVLNRSTGCRIGMMFRFYLVQFHCTERPNIRRMECNSDIVSRMRHAILKKRAEMVDIIIDHYKKARGLRNFPKKIVADVVSLMFPDSNFEGRGAFKEVHSVHSRARTLVLKLSNAKSTRRDWGVYQRLPAGIRNRYFARIYWHTKYCSLQKYGKKVGVTKQELRRLRMCVRKYGLKDIKAANVRKVEGHFKIVDAYPS
jgi:hypothetical protein